MFPWDMGLTPGWMAALMKERYTKVSVMVSECINVPKPLLCTEVGGIWAKDRGRYVCTYTHPLSQYSSDVFNHKYLYWCPVTVSGGYVL